MKLLWKLSRCGQLFFVLMAAGFIAGCSTGTSSMGGRGDDGAAALANAARFRIGETITVTLTTGSYDQQSQMPIHEEPIKEDGSITLPLIGKVIAAGKTPGELQNEIHDAYVPKYYVRLTVTVRSEQRVYYVGGEVAHPGAQVYLGETTVTKAIQAAGDFTLFGNHSKVWLIRANGQRIKVNCNQALENPSQDPAVYPGDQIQVPRRTF